MCTIYWFLNCLLLVKEALVATWLSSIQHSTSHRSFYRFVLDNLLILLENRIFTWAVLRCVLLFPHILLPKLYMINVSDWDKLFNYSNFCALRTLVKNKPSWLYYCFLPKIIRQIRNIGIIQFLSRVSV